MKTVKMLMLVLVASVAAVTARANDDRPISFTALPAKAQAFVGTHFAGIDVSYSQVDRELFGNTYEVFFVNGSKVEFNSDGEWDNVDCLRAEVPAAIIPESIANFVRTNHPGQIIVQIDRDRRSYDIELRNGLEIKFDLRFNVIGYDD
jgi:hypothetical protein